MIFAPNEEAIMTESDRKKPGARLREDDKEALLEDLREAGKNLSADDLKAQRMSYVIGCVAGDDKKAREKVRQYLEESYSIATEP